MKAVSAIVPYVVPPSYPVDPACTRPLGHGLQVVLAEDLDGLVTGLRPASLEAFGVDSVERAWSIALQNVDEVFATKVKAQRFPPTDGAPPFIFCGGHWLAGSCAVLPRLHGWASQVLGQRELLVSLPQREALVIFPVGTRGERDRMREKIRAAERDARKPLTWELFTLGPSGLAEFREP